MHYGRCAWRSGTSGNRNEERATAMYPEERECLVVKELKHDNPNEFTLNCEREMKLIDNNLTGEGKIDFVSKHFQDSTERWFS